MTHELRRLIEVVSAVLPKQKDILEIGSRQEKNQHKISNLRRLFHYRKYIGIDMRKGPGVDLVANAEKLPFPDKSFSLVLCLETLEHARQPWIIAREMIRVLKINGILVVSSQQNYPLHRHPSDYFRYTPYGLVSLFPALRDNLTVCISPPYLNEARLNPRSVILVGWLKSSRSMKQQLIKQIYASQKYISGHKPYRHRLRDGLAFIKRGLEEMSFRQEILISKK